MLKKQLLIQIHIVTKALPTCQQPFPFPQLGLLIPGFPGKSSLRSKENTSTPILWALDPYKDILTAPQHPLDEGLALTYHLLPLRRWTGNLIHTHTLAYTHTCCHPVVSILSSSYRACAQMSHTHTHTHTLHGHRHTVGSKPQGFPSEIRNQPQTWRIKRDQRNRPPLQLVGDDSHKQGNLRTMLVLAAAKHIDLHTCLPET